MESPDQERQYLTREYLKNHGWSPDDAPDAEGLLESTAKFFRDLLDTAGGLLGPEGMAEELVVSVRLKPKILETDVDEFAARSPCGAMEVHLPAMHGLVSRCLCIRVEK